MFRKKEQNKNKKKEGAGAGDERKAERWGKSLFSHQAPNHVPSLARPPVQLNDLEVGKIGQSHKYEEE
jgi:hypothetical protein